MIFDFIFGAIKLGIMVIVIIVAFLFVSYFAGWLPILPDV